MRTIYTFWTGNNTMSEARIQNLEQFRTVCDCDVVLITNDVLPYYISEPLHQAFPFLSETHKADYLRTYFMNFYGGGYSDIKKTTGSWIPAFEELEQSDMWINGYKEVQGGVAYEPHINMWNELIGNGAYICKPNTPLTNEWYSEMVKVLDSKLELLKEYPSTYPQDCSEKSNGKYPIGWNEILGRIFHRITYSYRDKMLRSLPLPIFTNYR